MDVASRQTDECHAGLQALRASMFLSWPVGAAPAQMRASFRRSEPEARLRKAMPDSGAYFSEANYYEPGWLTGGVLGRCSLRAAAGCEGGIRPAVALHCHQCVELPSPTPRRV